MNIIKSIVAVVILSAAFINPVFAQSADSSANVDTNTSSTAQSGLLNSQTFVTDSSGTQTVKNVPSIGIGGFSNSFASYYCYGTAGGSFAIAGAGGSYGKPVLDEGCQLFNASEMVMRIENNLRGEAKGQWELADYLEAKRDTLLNSKKALTNTDVYNINMLAAQVRESRAKALVKAATADNLELAAVYNLCSINEKIRKNLVKANLDCPNDTGSK